MAPNRLAESQERGKDLREAGSGWHASQRVKFVQQGSTAGAAAAIHGRLCHSSRQPCCWPSRSALLGQAARITTATP